MAASPSHTPGERWLQYRSGDKLSIDMRLSLILIVLAIPLIEIAALIKVGQVLGFWPTLLAIILAGISGAAIIRSQGLSALQRVARAVEDGQPPLEPAVDSMLIVLAGLLLLIPGFVSDVAGCLLLVPALRRLVARWGFGRMLSSSDMHVETHEWRVERGDGRRPDRSPGSGRPIVIEGEYQRIDDPKDERSPSPRK